MRYDRRWSPDCHGYEGPDAGADGAPGSHTGEVVIRLSRRLSVTTDDALSKMAKRLDLRGLRAVMDRHELKSCRRVARHLSPRRIDELGRAAMRSPLPPLRSLNQYWCIDVRDRPERAGEVRASLAALPEVDAVYAPHAVTDPVVDPTDDVYAADQGYLDAAPFGIDARWAWTLEGAQGAGVGFVDLEQAWAIKHEDIFVAGEKIPHLVFGSDRTGVLSESGEGFLIPFPPDHGTAVLGITAGNDNDRGIVGIAPGVTSVRLSSHFDAETDTDSNVVDAILGAIDDGKKPVMEAGDILLLEVQTLPGGWPVEIDDAVFDAIRLASALGIVVIEAAGNGGGDLDNFPAPEVARIFDRTLRTFRDSGAIMVGACASELNAEGLHDRAEFSVHGSRIDCHAWGENVVTCGYGDLDPGDAPDVPPDDDGGGDPPVPTGGDDGGFGPAETDGFPLPQPVGNANESYTSSFGGTSAASAIIAGAALVVQSKHQHDGRARLSPLQMRALLSDPATGTAQGGGVAGNIGVMPDLRAILSDGLCLVPDVYVRDYVGDTGAVPSAFENISRSPDVIVTTAPVADPQAGFGEGSGTEDDYTLARVEQGQNNFIYVRMRNRGSGTARGVRAHVYWSELLSLINPGDWQLIGTTDPVDVPAGNTLTVAGPVVFSANSPDLSPRSDSFLVLLDHPGDPAPLIPGPLEGFWDFYAFVQNNNNVTWHGFRVVDEVPDPLRPGLLGEFTLAGTDDAPRRFDFEITRQLPRGTRLWWELPLSLAGQIVEARGWPTEIDRRRGVALIRLPTLPCLRIHDLQVATAARLRSRFWIEGHEDMDRGGHEVTLRQVHDGYEVGRLEWRLAPRAECSKRPGERDGS